MRYATSVLRLSKCLDVCLRVVCVGLGSAAFKRGFARLSTVRHVQSLRVYHA